MELITTVAMGLINETKWRKTAIDVTDWLISPNIWRTNPTIDVISRARVLTAVLYLSLLVHGSAWLMLLGLSAFLGFERFGLAIIAQGVVVFMVGLQCIYLHLRTDLEASATWFCRMYLVLISSAAALTGGWQSPVLPMLITLPIAVFLTSNWKRAEYYTIGSFAVGWALMVVEVAGIALPNLMRPQNFAWAQGIVWWLSSLYLMLLFASLRWMYQIDKQHGGTGAGRLRTMLDTDGLSIPLELPAEEIDQALSCAKSMAKKQAEGSQAEAAANNVSV